MDLALETAYNKPAKILSGIIGILRMKRVVDKWNTTKQDKSKLATLMYELCSLNEDDEYSLHHKFSFRSLKLILVSLQQQICKYW